MLQPGYNAGFARVYDLRWTYFARQFAPLIRAYYESTPSGQRSRRLLDVCCGTGQLALHFLDHEYTVTGLDLSEAMLEYARQGAAPYIVAGQARFVVGNAADFSLGETFGLVVSTFDALNHLPDLKTLQDCFTCVYNHLDNGGMFIFDLNTRYGLSRWTGISVEDTPELMLVLRSLFDALHDRAYTYISGFIPDGSGRYERFDDNSYETVFDLEQVRQSLAAAGFQQVRFARGQDLAVDIAEPERETRIFITAEKPL